MCPKTTAPSGPNHAPFGSVSALTRGMHVAHSQHPVSVPGSGPSAVIGSILGPAPAARSADLNAALVGPGPVVAVAAPVRVLDAAPVPVPSPGPIRASAPAPTLASAPVDACSAPAPNHSPAGSGPAPSAPCAAAGSVPLLSARLNPVGSLSADLERYVDELEDDDDDEDEFEDGIEEGSKSAMFFTTHSPKTRGQKAMMELSLTSIPTQPKGSGRKGKKKGKRAKR